MFQILNDAQRVQVVIETARTYHRLRKRLLPGMTKRRMTQIVGERNRLGKIFIRPKRLRQRASDMRSLKRMRQARSKMIVMRRRENLRLPL